MQCCTLCLGYPPTIQATYVVHKGSVRLCVSILLAVVHSKVDHEQGKERQDSHVHDDACQIDTQANRFLPNLAWVGAQLEVALGARYGQPCCIAAVLIQQQCIPPLDC